MSKRLRIAEILFAFALFVFGGRFPLIDELSDTNLAFHMTVQHIILFIPGLILGAQLVKLTTPSKSLSVALTAIAVVLIAFWHIPVYWDLALENEFVHLLEHLSFFIAGALIYMSLFSLGSPVKWFSLVLYLLFISILAANALGGIRGRQIYQTSSAAQHTEFAMVMVFTMPVIFLVIVLSPLYLPKLTSFWTDKKLSLYLGGLLIVALIFGIFLMG